MRKRLPGRRDSKVWLRKRDLHAVLWGRWNLARLRACRARGVTAGRWLGPGGQGLQYAFLGGVPDSTFLCTAWEFPEYFSFPTAPLPKKSCQTKVIYILFLKQWAYLLLWLRFYYWTQWKNKPHLLFKVKEQKLTRVRREHDWILILFIIHLIFSFSFSIAPHNSLTLLYINILCQLW